MKNIKWSQSNGKLVCKVGRKIKGFVFPSNDDNGYSYAFGKPSQNSFLAFSGGKYPLTLEQAMERVEERVRECQTMISKISRQ